MQISFSQRNVNGTYGDTSSRNSQSSSFNETDETIMETMKLSGKHRSISATQNVAVKSSDSEKRTIVDFFTRKPASEKVDNNSKPSSRQEIVSLARMIEGGDITNSQDSRNMQNNNNLSQHDIIANAGTNMLSRKLKQNPFRSPHTSMPFSEHSQSEVTIKHGLAAGGDNVIFAAPSQPPPPKPSNVTQSQSFSFANIIRKESTVNRAVSDSSANKYKAASKEELKDLVGMLVSTIEYINLNI
jgi:hypothetical protein